MSDWYEQALANAKKKDAEKRKKEDDLAKSPKYQNEQLKGQVYAGSAASGNKPKNEPKSAKEVLKTMAGSGKTTNKLDNKKKQQNKKAAAVGATSTAKSSSVKKTTGYKKSAVNTDTLKATKKIAESQEKKLPTKRNGSGKASVQKKETAKKTLKALKEVSKPTVKTAENYDPNPYTKEKIEAMFDQIATDDSLYGKFGRAYTGFSQGIIDAALGTANLVGSKVTGKDINLQERTGLNIDHEGLRNTKGFKGGQVAGEVAGYMMQGVAADPAIDALLAGTKLAKMGGKAGTAAKVLGRNAIESGTIGLAQNLGIAHQQGLEGMDFAKDVALNTALDFAAGSTLGGVAAGLAAKGAKKGDDVAKAVAKIEEAPADIPKVATKAAEPVTEVAEETAPARRTLSRDKLRTVANPNTDAGYHAGDLGKAEFHDEMPEGRHTGHFGTGTYFVGNKAEIADYGNGRPKHRVDFSQYNLFKPKDSSDGWALHDTLKKVNENIKRFINSRDVNKAGIIAEIEGEGAGLEVQKYIDNNLSEAQLREYRRKAQQIYDEIALETPEEIEREVRARRRYFSKEFGLSSLDDVLIEDELIADEVARKIADNADFLERFDLDNHVRKLVAYDLNKNDYADLDKRLGLENEIIEELRRYFPEKSGTELAAALDNTIAKVSVYGNADGMDSASTVLMKELGYNGIDTRHLPGLDNTGYGSVIYDLNAKKNKPLPKADTTRKPPRTRNYSSNMEDLLAAEQEYDYAIEEAGRKIADYVRNYKGKGSLTTITPKFEDATGSGVRHTVSQNDPWYSEALKKYGNNKAVNDHADEIAADLLEGDLFRARGQQDFLDEGTYDYLKALEEVIDTNNNIVDNLSNKLPRGVDGRKLSNPSTVELPKTEPQLKGTGGRKLKANGVPEVHEKVNGFDVESSNIGIVDEDLRFVGETIDTTSSWWEQFKKFAISGQKELENLSKAAENTKVDDYTQAVRNKRGTVSYIFRDGLVDASGKKINDKSFKNLIGEIPAKEMDDFNTYAQHLHNIDRVREGKPVFKQYSAADSQQIVDDMLKKHPEFANYTKNINQWWREFGQAWLVDTGRLTQDAFDNMNKMYPNYIPTYRVGKNEVTVDASLPNKFNVGSGVKGAKGGSSDVLPLEDNFLAQIERIVSSTKKNDLYNSIIETLEADPAKYKQYGVPTKNADVLADHTLDDLLSSSEKTRLKEVEKGVYMVTAYRNGKPVSAYINRDMAHGLKLLDDAYGWDGLRWLATGGKLISDPMKAGITGYNPLFAVSNMFRDLPTLYIQSQHGMWKTTTGLGKALEKMLHGDELWEQYKAMGGKQSGYYAQGKGFADNLKGHTGVKKVWYGLQDILSTFGEITESAPRFAEFINSVEKYGDSKDAIMRAMKDAGEATVNFSRSAPVTKTLDAWMLYLNAAVQGLDKFGRTVKSAPLKTLGRGAAMITVPYAALMIANWDNPHYHDLNERTKQNYFCIPNIAGEKDSQGKAMTFIKIPLNREYGALLGSTLDLASDIVRGNEDPFKGYGETLENGFMPPINPVKDFILSPVLLDLPTNTDFAGRAIVPQSLEKASAINQQDGTTSGVAKGIAKATNAVDDRLKYINLPDFAKSPKKIDFLIDSYGGYIGQELQAATSAEAKDIQSLSKEAAVEPVKSRFTADPRYSSGVVSDFYDAKDAAETAKVDSKLAGNEFSEAHARYKVYTGIADQLSDLSAEERAIKSNKSLTKEQKTEKINALRTKKNELARGAKAKADAASKEYKQAPTYSALTKEVKERYDSKTGLSKEKYGKAYNAQKDLDTTAAKTLALLNNGVTTLPQAQNVNSKITEKAFEKAKTLQRAGIKANTIETSAKKINRDGNSYYSLEECYAYLDGNKEFNRQQKAAIVEALNGSKNSKYH